MGKKNWGFFGAHLASQGFREGNEYFSFKKNIQDVILRWTREKVIVREGNEALGWKSRGTQVFKSIWKDSKLHISKPNQMKIQAITYPKENIMMFLTPIFWLKLRKVLRNIWLHQFEHNKYFTEELKEHSVVLDAITK